MITLVVIVPRQLDIDRPSMLLRNLRHVIREPTGRLIAEEGDEWVAVSLDNSLANAYEAPERDFILSTFPEPAYLLVEGRGERLVNKVLSDVDDSTPLLVDNDHGLIVPIDEVKRRVEKHRPWLFESS